MELSCDWTWWGYDGKGIQVKKKGGGGGERHQDLKLIQ